MHFKISGAFWKPLVLANQTKISIFEKNAIHLNFLNTRFAEWILMRFSLYFPIVMKKAQFQERRNLTCYNFATFNDKEVNNNNNNNNNNHNNLNKK